MLIEKELHIVLKGNTEDAIVFALDEAVTQIKCGQREGFNRNVFASFYFDVVVRD
jgi:hypothetical protein